jgi:hypothetical protein
MVTTGRKWALDLSSLQHPKERKWFHWISEDHIEGWEWCQMSIVWSGVQALDLLSVQDKEKRVRIHVWHEYTKEACLLQGMLRGATEGIATAGKRALDLSSVQHPKESKWFYQSWEDQIDEWEWCQMPIM